LDLLGIIKGKVIVYVTLRSVRN